MQGYIDGDVSDKILLQPRFLNGTERNGILHITWRQIASNLCDMKPYVDPF